MRKKLKEVKKEIKIRVIKKNCKLAFKRRQTRKRNENKKHCQKIVN